MDLDFDEIQEFVSQITSAIRCISHGEMSPTGLEGLAMSIAGDSLRLPLSESVDHVADAIERVADALDRIAIIADAFRVGNREPE
ncbi:MAG TPA: hypothetical protein PKX12_13595 [Spirochaetota bacterium]|nr:hypothetical protein [Spirochaetota bacterium]